MRFVMPLFLVIALAVGAAVRPMLAEVKPLIPVTQQMLEQPSPDDSRHTRCCTVRPGKAGQRGVTMP